MHGSVWVSGSPAAQGLTPRHAAPVCLLLQGVGERLSRSMKPQDKELGELILSKVGGGWQ